MDTDPRLPALSFFRATPAGLLDLPPLASSLQSFETSLFLIGARRYPSALVSCATAWESALKAGLGLTPEGRTTLQGLVRQARTESPGLRQFDSAKLDNFRTARNRLVHFGFSPKDDELCAVLLVDTGFPFLKLCYREMFRFYLDWREIRPGARDLVDLSPEDLNAPGLLPEVATQLARAEEVLRRTAACPGLSGGHCLGGLAHFIWLWVKETAMTRTEAATLEHGDGVGIRFEEEERAKHELEAMLDHPTYAFSCPYCCGFDSIVAELDDAKLDLGEVVTKRCVCVRCGFSVGPDSPFLSEVVLEEGIASKRAEILKDFGIAG